MLLSNLLKSNLSGLGRDRSRQAGEKSKDVEIYICPYGVSFRELYILTKFSICYFLFTFRIVISPNFLIL